jgi:hypothetical protein
MFNLCMVERMKVIRFKYKSLLGVFESAKYDCETTIERNNMADPLNVTVCRKPSSPLD